MESEDAAKAVSFFRWNLQACDEIIVRGVDACEQRGVSPGTRWEWFVPNAFDSPGLVRADVESALRFDLEGRNPRLALAAERSDGSLALVFLLDPRQGQMYPGPVPVGGDPQIAIWLATAADDPAAIVTYDHIYQGAPPLEFLRYDQHFGIRSFVVWGVSDEFTALEQAFHDRNELDRREP